MKLQLIRSLAVGAIAAAAFGTAMAAPFTLNNIFVSTAVGTVVEYTPTGTLVQTLTAGTGAITGTTFDSTGNLYVTRFSNNAVQKFSNGGVNLGTFGGGYSTPESVVIDGAGNIYVGNTGGTIRKFDPAGTFLSQASPGRVDFMDLAADQTTMLYTQELGEIKRVNVATGVALTDFSSAVENAFALRIRANGQVLVADGADIELLDAAGNQIGSYDAVGTGDQRWFGLNLDPDGISFWSAQIGGLVAHFDIATGNLISSFNTGSTVFGLSIFGEITVGNPPPTGVPEPGALSLAGLALLGLALTRRRAAKVAV